MTGTGNAVAVHNGTAPAPSGALAIYADQVSWTTMQEAALNQLGLRNASDGDRMVFLHQAQRTGLDPFAKQIHMIERGGKWGIQTGIDGFRVMRARAERTAGVRGVLGRPVFYDGEGNEYKVWFRPQPPVACEITYTVRELSGTETPYTSVLRFTEYAQYKVDKTLTQKWAGSPAHMLEKCTEADVYRKAFPQDFSGVDLSDSPSAPDEDAPPAQPQRQRVTAADARARSPQTVTTTVVTPDASPAVAGDPPLPADAPRPADAPTEQAAGEALATPDQVKAIWTCMNKDYGFAASEKDEARAAVAVLARHQPLSSVNDLTAAKASRVLDQLHEWVSAARETGERPRDILAADIASRDDGQDGEPDE